MADDTNPVQGTTDTTADSAVQPVPSLLTAPVEGETENPAADPAASVDPNAPKAESDPAKAEGEDPEGKKDGDDKPEGAPEKYEFTAPEGVTLDAEAVAEFEPVAREMNLTNEQAQKLVELQTKLVQKQMQQWDQTVDGWVSTIKSDQEIGGEGLKQNIALAQRALSQFGTPELKAALDATRMGSHPELVRVFARIGKAMAEDTFVAGKTPAPAERKGLYSHLPKT
jgi:hypothetical protein